MGAWTCTLSDNQVHAPKDYTWRSSPLVCHNRLFKYRMWSYYVGLEQYDLDQKCKQTPCCLYLCYVLSLCRPSACNNHLRLVRHPSLNDTLAVAMLGERPPKVIYATGSTCLWNSECWSFRATCGYSKKILNLLENVMSWYYSCSINQSINQPVVIN